MKQKVSLVEVESLPDIMEMEDILFYDTVPKKCVTGS